MLLGVIILIAVITRSNLKAVKRPGNVNIGVYIKIMTNYFQIITLVNAFKLEWP